MYLLTERVLPHTGLPYIHITWLIDHLGKNVTDCISSEFTAWKVKAIYGAKVSKYSDDLLKGTPLSNACRTTAFNQVHVKDRDKGEKCPERFKQGRRKWCVSCESAFHFQ